MRRPYCIQYILQKQDLLADLESSRESSSAVALTRPDSEHAALDFGDLTWLRAANLGAVFASSGVAEYGPQLRGK